jgi:SET domain-containing protein
MALLEKHLYISKSQLPQAGKGLFTKIDIPKGTRIVEYKGSIHTWKEVKDQDGYNGYLMHINWKTVINAGPYKKVLARYANDARGLTKIKGLKNNAEYITEGNRCFIEAKRAIGKKEEIFVHYGNEYWKLMQKIRNERNKKTRM